MIQIAARLKLLHVAGCRYNKDNRMKLGYSKTLIITTDDLPGVICDPAIKIEFINIASVSQIQEIGSIVGGFDAHNLDIDKVSEVAQRVIINVFGEDNEVYPIDSELAVSDLLEAIGFDLLAHIVIGWVLLASRQLSDIAQRKKKSKILKIVSNSTNQAA